ncbi:hypothetical protein VFPPC_15255 [Pochonia chlamydosporia 170]|uniref:DUF1168 domain-containing protein n=1 Tax=Pochonia chlamydosporia 170 TaxID=1380566 RepID=A0A179G5K8_METCM|nr:hypothetical protein VFPPC_15255 [Pochonia chlamydosporia 170]OAQ73114.1 hypothetical protein VFPPC_15255 [Pochonia chlamydosporia 170]
MSAPGPESIPTSADPRSHRPTKKRALTPTSSQAASLTALFAKPDQNIPLASSSGPRHHHIPEIYTNVQGSSAGAGSGEFHVYKASRRREYERLKEMDDSLRREKEQDEFEKGRVERARRDEEKTRRNRERREKMKARKAKKGKGTGVAERTDGEAGREGRGEEKGCEEKAEEGHAGLIIHDDD